MTLTARIKRITDYSSVGQWYAAQTYRIASVVETVMNEHLEDSKLVGAIQDDCGLTDDQADLEAQRQIIRVLAEAYGMTAEAKATEATLGDFERDVAVGYVECLIS